MKRARRERERKLDLSPERKKGPMAWTVVVKVRGTNDDEINSPEMSEEEANAEVAAIRDVLGLPRVPDLDWLAVSGQDIVSAHTVESGD